MGSASALAFGQELLQDKIVPADDPAVQVEARAPSIRIARLKATPVDPKIYAKIATSRDVTAGAIAIS